MNVTTIRLMSGRHRLSHEDARASRGLDLPLSELAEEPGLHNEGLLGHLSGSQHLEVALLHEVQHWGLAGLLGDGLNVLLGDHGPQVLDVDAPAVEAVLDLVEVPHTDLRVMATSRARTLPFRSNQGGTCRKEYGGGSDHRPYHDHRDAYDACQPFRDRGTRGP
ncbi:R3H domain-containing protein, putative [Babesia ovata]|uniref:R3H domain-containing protein, putative n=1 Tax=Babesia ovata TaxID=189622 RepID=A0A2H6K7G3_9APIC|nr:R3H domain-containing protein, putative [Babesia ovata]GBE58937.1 R3H domain-containing protein, putative [Babesia ovata]